MIALAPQRIRRAAAPILLATLVLAARALAQTPVPDVIAPADTFDYAAGTKLSASNKWQGLNLQIEDDPAAPGTGLVSVEPGQVLGMAWFDPEGADPDGNLVDTPPEIEQDKMTVRCQIDLKGAVAADNKGPCFRSAAILVLRGTTLITLRVFVTREYDDTGPAPELVLRQYLEVNVRGSKTVRQQVNFDPVTGPVPAKGQLSLTVPTGPGPKKVLASYTPTGLPPTRITGGDDVNFSDLGVTHVGIQLRRPVNLLPSPTIDTLETVP
jgi:hypothetical protein